MQGIQSHGNDSNDDSRVTQYVHLLYLQYHRRIDRERAQQQHRADHWTDETGARQQPLQGIATE